MAHGVKPAIRFMGTDSDSRVDSNGTLSLSGTSNPPLLFHGSPGQSPNYPGIRTKWLTPSLHIRAQAVFGLNLPGRRSKYLGISISAGQRVSGMNLSLLCLDRVFSVLTVSTKISSELFQACLSFLAILLERHSPCQSIVL